MRSRVLKSEKKAAGEVRDAVSQASIKEQL